MVMILSVKADISRATRDLDNLARKQIPFAQAQAVNSLAAFVQQAEQKAIKATFPTATPFTVASVRVKRARKSDPTATVYIGQIIEPVLAPYITGGRHFLGSKRGILNPKAVNVNQFGNIAKGRLAALKGSSDVFIGSIKTKNGQTINGVFQRGNFTVGKRRPGGTPDKRKIKPQRSRLKILIRFGDALTVTERLPWFETATGVVQANAYVAMQAAMTQALATARP